MATFRYHQNVYILDDSVAYRNEVARYLDLIRTTYAGRTLLKHIYARGKTVLIIPYSDAKYHQGPVNSAATADDGVAASLPGEPINGVRELPDGRKEIVPNEYQGTGAGSSSTVKFHPAIYRQVIQNKGRIDPGDGPGEALFHELIHALRFAYGTNCSDAVPEDPGMGDFEEFCAVVGANIYRSERGFRLLRKNHEDHNVLGRDLSHPEKFAKHFSDSLEKWFSHQPAFCLALSASKATFNPLKYTAQSLGLSLPVSMKLP